MDALQRRAVARPSAQGVAGNMVLARCHSQTFMWLPCFTVNSHVRESGVAGSVGWPVPAPPLSSRAPPVLCKPEA